MILIGCDFRSRYQQIASVNTETGDLVEKRLGRLIYQRNAKAKTKSGRYKTTEANLHNWRICQNWVSF
jgi:hypothetical protein